MLAGDTLEVASDAPFEGDGATLYDEVVAVLDDDLKTPLAVALLFDALAAANSAADAGDDDESRDLADGHECALRGHGSGTALDVRMQSILTVLTW